MEHKKITLYRILHGIKKWRWEHRRWNVFYPICCKMFPVSSNKVCFIIGMEPACQAVFNVINKMLWHHTQE